MRSVAPTYPPEARRLYGPLLDALFQSLHNRTTRGIPVERVADAVFHALTGATPNTRYVIGRSTKIRVWIERLPDRLRDRVMIGRMPKYGPTYEG